jgi:integrase
MSHHGLTVRICSTRPEVDGSPRVRSPTRSGWVRQRWGKRDKLELYELRHACATLLMERGLPPHVVANQLGHTDGGALVQRLYGHPSEPGMRDQVRLAFAGWGADAEQRRAESPGNS